MRRSRWDDDAPGAVAGVDADDARCLHLAAAEAQPFRKVRGLPREGPTETMVPAGSLGDFNRGLLEARIEKLAAKVLVEDPEFRRSRLRKPPK